MPLGRGSFTLPEVGSLSRRLQAYSSLSPDDLQAIDLATAKVQREVGARRDLVREGDMPKCVSVILDGWACRYKTLPDGRRQIVAFLMPSDICDLNLCFSKEMDHSVGAITRLRVAEIGREEFEAQLMTRPRIVQALWRSELATVSIQREWTLNLGQRTAFERIAHLLCELYLRLEAMGLAGGDRCEFPLTQIDLADATGLTPVHVNRTLQELRRAGLIELQNKALNIPNMAELKRAGMFNPSYLHLGSGRSQPAEARA